MSPQTIEDSQFAVYEEAVRHIRGMLGMPSYATPQAVAVEAELAMERLKGKALSLEESRRLAMNGILALSTEVAEQREQLKDLKAQNKKIWKAATDLRQAVLKTTPDAEAVVTGVADEVARACAAIRDLPISKTSDREPVRTWIGWVVLVGVKEAPELYDDEDAADRSVIGWRVILRQPKKLHATVTITESPNERKTT